MMSVSTSLTIFKKSLSLLSEAVLGLTQDNRRMSEIWGWQFPPLSRYDLSEAAKNISSSLEMFESKEEDDDLELLLDDLTQKIDSLRTAVIVYFFTGNANATAAVSIYIQTLTTARMLLEPYFAWVIIADKEMMPKHLARKLKGIDERINTISPNMESLEAKIATIKEASEAADSLPTDLEELKKARTSVEDTLKHLLSIQTKIEELEKKAIISSGEISISEEISKKSIAKIDEHLQIATTNGLARAFRDRASELKRSVWYWVAFLAGSLWLGMYTAHSNLSALNEALTIGNSNSIAVNIVLSLLGVGGSVWFAWISTKQIGQRFRLAEDYAFKASVAMAYEGYRQEAVRIDEVFEARLFASTLTRLEEAPLRLIEDTTHGSPFQEFFNSEGFKKAFETIPEFKRDILGLFKKGETDSPTDESAKKAAPQKASGDQGDEE